MQGTRASAFAARVAPALEAWLIAQPRWREWLALLHPLGLLAFVLVALGVRLALHYVLAQMPATAAMLRPRFAVNRRRSFR